MKAKEKQGYNPKPVFRMCSNCENFKSEIVITEYGYPQEKNIRCGLGNFAVKKQGNCKEHNFKQQ